MKIKNILMLCSLLTQATKITNYSSNPDMIVDIALDDQRNVTSFNSIVKFKHDERNFEICKREENEEEILFFRVNEIKQEGNETVKEAVNSFLLSTGLFRNMEFLQNIHNKEDNKKTQQGLDKKTIEVLSNIMIPEYIKIFTNKDFPEEVRNVFAFTATTIQSVTAIDNISAILSISLFFNPKKNKHTQELFSALNNDKNKEQITNDLSLLNLYENENAAAKSSKNDQNSSDKDYENELEKLKKNVEEKHTNAEEFLSKNREYYKTQAQECLNNQNTKKLLPSQIEIFVMNFKKLEEKKSDLQNTISELEKAKQYFNDSKKGKEEDIQEYLNKGKQILMECKLKIANEELTDMFKSDELNKSNTYSALLKLNDELRKVTIGYSEHFKCAKLYWEKNFYTSNKQSQ